MQFYFKTKGGKTAT